MRQLDILPHSTDQRRGEESFFILSSINLAKKKGGGGNVYVHIYKTSIFYKGEFSSLKFRNTENKDSSVSSFITN